MHNITDFDQVSSDINIHSFVINNEELPLYVLDR